MGFFGSGQVIALRRCRVGLSSPGEAHLGMKNVNEIGAGHEPAHAEWVLAQRCRRHAVVEPVKQTHLHHA
jgi:hypothetical protein